MLKTGETSAGNIIKDIGRHRQSVYNALSELERKELIIKNLVNGIYHYKIIDPKAFITNIKRKIDAAEQLEQAVAKELLKTKREHEINVYDGRDKIRRYFLQRYKKMPVDSYLHVISNYANRFEEVLGKDFLTKKYNTLMIKRKIRVKIITAESMRKEFKGLVKRLEDPKTREFRYISDELMSPVAIEITTEGVNFISFKKDWFIVEIKNEEFHDSYLEYFNSLWQIAKK